LSAQSGLCRHRRKGDVITANGTGPFGFIRGLVGTDIIFGSSANDRIDGGTTGDIIWRVNGDDVLIAAPINVTQTPNEAHIIDGGNGNDTIVGGIGPDNLTGGPDSDLIVGGFSSDTIHGGLGADVIYGHTDNDRDFAKDNIDCGSNSDHAYIRSSDGDTAKSNCENVIDYDG